MRKEEPKVSSYVKPILIIGSSSVWRKAIIEENFGTLFTLQCVSPGIDEKAIRDSNAESLVQKLSRAKLEAVRSKVFAELSRCPTTASELYVVCGDQVVRFESMIREKPVSKEENVAFLKSYRNKCIETVTCLAVERIEVLASGEGIFLNEASRDQGSGPPHSVCALDVQIDCVHFGDIPDSVIDQVVAKGESMQTCGGIVIEDPLLAPYITLGTSRTTGCAALVPSDKSQQRYAVMGFPVDMFRRLVGKVHCDNRGDVDHL